MNKKIRQFEDALIQLYEKFADIPIEARFLALQNVTIKVQMLADNAILNELEEETCKKPIQE